MEKIKGLIQLLNQIFTNVQNIHFENLQRNDIEIIKVIIILAIIVFILQKIFWKFIKIIKRKIKKCLRTIVKLAVKYYLFLG